MGRKKKVKPGVIELHATEPIIIVNYEMQYVETDKNGETHATEKQHLCKKIKIKQFNPNSNLSKIAKGVIQHCKYIHASKEEHVISLLQQLKLRILTAQNEDDEEDEEEEDQQHEAEEEEEEEAEDEDDDEEQPDDEDSDNEVHAEKNEMRQSKKPSPPQTHDVLKQQEDEKLKELQLQLERERNLRLQKEKELEQERQRIQSEKLRLEQEEKQRLKHEQEREEQERLRLLREEEDAKKKEEERKKLEEEQKKLEKKEKKKIKKLMKQQMKIEKEMEQNMPKEKAKIEHLDKYIENLYENEVKTKIAATYHILQLVQEPDYLAQFVEHKILLGALGRMLQEERKKDNELISNILEIFFCFSNFSQLHPILINAKIGATTMQIISHEMKRYELAINERNSNSNNSKSVMLASADMDESEMKFILFLHRQEKLLYICFYVLLNLAEDLQIETKMVQLGIVKYIMKTLRRDNIFRTWLDELVILLLTFAKKLSLFVENKSKFIEMGIVQVLFNIVNDTKESQRTDIDLSVIGLLFNLSFDIKCKQQMCDTGLLSWIVACLPMQHTQEFAIKCLYNLTTIDEYRSQICYTDAVSVITEMIIDYQERLIPSEIIALAINLSTCQRAVEIICSIDTNSSKREYLPLLIKRVHRTFDPLLMKMIYNVSCSLNDSVKLKFKRHLHELLGMAKACESQEFLVEVLGTISNLSYQGTTEIVAYHELITQYNLLEFFNRLLSHTLIEDDLLVAIVMVIGCFASTPKACSLFAEPRLLRLLVEHMYDKLYDEEIALQSVYTIFRLLLQQDSREYLCRESQCMDILQQLAEDKNSAIKHIAQLCLDVIIDFGEEWSESIKDKRFEQHNQEWIQFVDSVLTQPNTKRNVQQLSPTELRLRGNVKEEQAMENDDYLNDMQLQNMHFMSEISDDDDDDTDEW